MRSRNIEFLEHLEYKSLNTSSSLIKVWRSFQKELRKLERSRIYYNNKEDMKQTNENIVFGINKRINVKSKWNEIQMNG